MAFAVFLLAGMLALSWFYKPGLFSLGQPAPALTIMPENTVPLGETTLPLAVHSQPTSTRELTSTLRPSSTPTGTPTPVPITSIPLGLETPSGTTPQLLIHRIVPGDNLSQLAERYGTSAAAIQSINYFLPVPLWIDLMVVIPLNTTDVSALPAFETYQVKDGSLTLKDVAWALNTSSELVSRYNLVNPTTNLLVDSWLIIPRPFPPPTGLPLATQEGKIEK